MSADLSSSVQAGDERPAAATPPPAVQVVDLDARALATSALDEPLVLRRTLVLVADDSAVRHGCGAVVPSYFAGHRPRCPRCGQTA